MDSVSQFALGAAVSVAVMGRRTAVWKAALWGGLAGTIPDLDSFIDFGDAVRNMTFHRGHSHGLFWLTLGAPVLAWIASRLGGGRALFKRWWLALWLALVTHPLLDTMTVYGTQLLQPFSEHPFALGSIFIIDPLYTVPLLVGLVVALARRAHRGLAWNRWGLALSCLYLGWSAAAQWHVRQIAEESLAARGVQDAAVLVTPAPLNTVLWRVVAVKDDRFLEGFYSLLDPQRSITFRAFDRGLPLYESLDHLWPVARMAWFSRGFFKMSEEHGQAFITDLRMGQEPGYVFSFRVARRGSGWQPAEPENLGWRGDVGRGIEWIWARMWDSDLPPLE
ncbi:metal-dependent hydrolase [Ramlibacter rhizophilus]|uniref:Metal-dependent hydrolase n=1 Tax=Ramlibacter rhizophilus TaxID=1781167 RepID=A0A4Z0BFG2_9BURK|nr:metal-dependent hydrolase [Ramlibacter rhizophilus]TFY98066.1 metal-dependent hydrolase [Ramlibacter rhizophilus]